MFAGGEVMDRLDDGEWDEAFALADETLDRVEIRIGNAVAAIGALALASFERGDDEAARRLLGRLPPDMAQSTNQQMAGGGRFVTALDAFLGGRLQDGIGELQQAGELFVSFGSGRLSRRLWNGPPTARCSSAIRPRRRRWRTCSTRRLRRR